MVYVLIFKLPKKAPAFGVKINRKLKEIGAKKLQNSVWEANDLEGLTTIAVWIKNAGGKVNILEKRKIL